MQKGSRAKYLSAAYYGLLSFLLVAILFKFLRDVLPVGAGQVAHNSEAYLAAIGLGLWVQFARERLHGSRREWPITIAAALACLAVALTLYYADGWTTRVTTLNEAFFGLALVIPFVQPRHRRPSVAAALSAVVLAVVVLGGSTRVVEATAETLAILLLVPVALDVADRGILDPDAPNSPVRRYAWYGLLVATPIVMHVLEYKVEIGGWAGEVTRYGVRFYEAFVFLLIFQLFFTIGLGRTGRPARGAVTGPPRPAPAAR